MARGYDNIAVYQQTVLDIPMSEGTGTLAHDISRQAATDQAMTLTGPPAWYAAVLSNMMMLNLNSATPDYLLLSAANSADLNFQGGSFSGVAWIYPHTVIGEDRHIFARGLLSTDGWEFLVQDTGEITLITNQAGATQLSSSAAGSVVAVTWYMIGFTRHNADVYIYRNGVNVTSVVGVHVDPLTSARDLHIGTSDAHANSFDGYLWRPRVWERELDPVEMLELFDMERTLVGV